jgi:adenylate kinase family enzyme
VDRIAVVGPVASGKTTLANRLGSHLGLPVFDLDDFYWTQNPLPSEQEWAATHRVLIGRDRWIISGDYRAVADERFAASDTVVWLDLPRLTCLYRVTRRKLRGSPTPLLDSWRWVWRYPKHGRHQTETSLANLRLTCSLFRLRSSADVAALLAKLGSSQGRA